MVGLQYQYNEAAANNNMTGALEMWRKTGYQAQEQQIKDAGLNKALWYGGGGASAVSQSQGNSGVNYTDTILNNISPILNAKKTNTNENKPIEYAKETNTNNKKPIEYAKETNTNENKPSLNYTDTILTT